jgi:hypothetical protein
MATTPSSVGTTPNAKLPKSDAERKQHAKLMSWFQQEMSRQAHNRYQMSMDEDYYDSMQWLPEEAAELKGRGQNPTVYNEVKPTIDWLIGLERRTRTDFNIMSRDDSPEADEDAKTKTKLLKYIAEANRAEFERSSAADDAFKAGLGWLEVGINPDPEDEPIYVRGESWRNMVYDSLGSRRDLSDSRYLYRFRMVDLDIAIAFFPDKEHQLRASCVTRDADMYMDWWNSKPTDDLDFVQSLPGKFAMYDSDAWSNNNRERVMLIEAWYKEPTTDSRGGTSSVDRVKMQMRCTILTEKHVVLDVKSPYDHNKYPFVPLWAYRRKKDNAPYSPIRPVRGPQDALNKRMSKALFVLSTNQVIAEAGAFDASSMTPQEVRDEVRAPDGFVILAKGGMEKFKVNRENDVAQGHLQLAQTDQAMIRNASGISSENLGRDSNITAGIALKQKAEQGGQLTAELFDNMLFARQLEGELTLSLIEQFYTDAKIFGVTGERQKREYTRINQPDPANPGEKLNDITKRKAQFIIGDQAWRQSLQQAAFESLMQLLTGLAPTAPQIVMGLLDTVFELADIPNKRVILQRIRTITGQTDPDEPQSPEQQQVMQQQQAVAQKQIEAQMAQLDADIAKAKATGNNLDAKSLETTLKALYVAMQAAQVITTVPQVSPVADALLKSAGFVDKDGGTVAPQPDPMAAQPMAADPMTDLAMQAMPPEQAQGQIQDPMLANGAQAGIQTPTGADNTGAM